MSWMPSGEQPSRRRIWLLLAIGCLAGLSTYLVTPLESPDQLTLASDVYRHAVRSYLEGGDLYGVYPPGRDGYAYLYPPLTVLVFLPHALLWSDTAAFALQTALNLLAAVGTAVVIFGALQRRGVSVDRRDLVLLLGFMLLSTYSAIQFMNGQVNLWLAFAIALGFEWIDRRDGAWSGVLFATVALMKVFPAVLGLWLLRIRARRAVLAAIATGLGGLLLGAALFGPELTVTYLEDVLLGRFEGSTYDGQPHPDDNVDGIHRQLAALWPGGGAYHTAVALFVIGPLVALSLLWVDTQFRRDVAGLGVLVGILLFLPLQPLYFPLIVFPLVMVLYTLPRGRERNLLLAGTLLTFVNLDLATIELAFGVLPVPAAIETSLLAVASEVLTVVLPPTLGLWMILLTCALIQLPPLEIRGGEVSPAPG